MTPEDQAQELAQDVLEDLIKKLRKLKKEAKGTDHKQAAAMLRKYAKWLDTLWWRGEEHE